jgi:hypothetical protein
MNDKEANKLIDEYLEAKKPENIDFYKTLEHYRKLKKFVNYVTSHFWRTVVIIGLILSIINLILLFK